MRQSIFIGTVTTTPELRTTHEGTPVCNLEILVRERKGTGAMEEHRFPITVWGIAAQRVARQAKAGSEVVAFCKPENRTYQNKNGQQRTSRDNMASWIRVCQPEDPAEAAAES